MTDNENKSVRNGNRRMSFRSWMILTLLFVWIMCVGCGHNEKQEPVAPAAPQEQKPESGTEPTEDSGQDETNVNDDIPLRPGMNAELLLRQMIDSYAKAKIYSDDAYIEALYEMKIDGRKRIVSNRRPCSVAFEKPNRIRLAVNHGLLVSDGKKIQGKILKPAYESEYYEMDSPLLISAIREMYPDPLLASEMNMEVPANVTWVPPQLILLLAKSPLKTFLPQNSTMQLISPKTIIENDVTTGKPKTTVCDRVEINAEDGTRTLWISRENNALVRFQFPLEQIEVPKNVERVVRLTIEFRNILLSAEKEGIKFDRKMFSLDLGENAKKVDAFLPLEMKITGKKISGLSLRPLMSGFSPIKLDEPNGKIRVVCFWRGIDQKVSMPAKRPETPEQPIHYPDWPGSDFHLWDDSVTFFNEIERTAGYLSEEPQVSFYAVNTDSTATSDEVIRDLFGRKQFSTQLYRLESDEFRNNIIETLRTPSLFLIDSKGIIQKCYRQSISSVKLDRDLKQLIAGRNIYDEDIAAYRSRCGLFESNLNMASDSDFYATKFEPDVDEVAVLHPQILPKNLSMEKVWTITTLRHPGNPLPVAGSDFFPPNDSKADQGDVIIVPCEGNALAVIDARGNIIKKIVPQAALSEPVSFIHAYKNQEGKTCYAASALRESKKIHRFGPGLEDLGSLDIGRLRGQSVADFCFSDINGDGNPEMLLGLLGDSVSNAIPIHGLYAVDMKTQKILWKDENIYAPYRIGIWHSAEKPDQTMLLALNRPEGAAGSLVEDDATTGKRVRDILPQENASILWFTTADLYGKGQKELAVLLMQSNPERLFFAGLTSDGAIRWKHPLSQNECGRQMDPLIAADINGDGIKEWLVLFSDGTILIFAPDGKLMDRIQYGEEITGACVVQWKTDRFLIVTDIKTVTAWKINGK